MTFSFPGGVHLPDAKRWSAEKVIERAPRPRSPIILFLQHAGTPARPIVKPGDLVTTGQKIAEADGYVSVPCHASVAGRVRDLRTYPHPTLPRLVLGCTIESDGTDTPDPAQRERPDWNDLKPDAIRRIVREAGIVGLGGAGFPTHVKLTPPPGRSIDTLVLNGCECEPALTGDARLMIEHARSIAEGARLMARALGARQIVAAIEDNKPESVTEMRDAVSHLANARVVVLPTRYPQGGERQLIQSLFRRPVPADGMPSDIGIVVQNVATAYAVYHAVRHGRPLIERVVTVTGYGIREPRNLWVRIGTPVADLIEFCGGLRGEPGKIIFGGPMTGSAQCSFDAPIIKSTAGVLVLGRRQVRREHPAPCVRCARCVDVCPMQLVPCDLEALVENRRFAEADRLHLLDCIECGCCAYVCPSRRRLVHSFQFGKSELWAKKATAAAS